MKSKTIILFAVLALAAVPLTYWLGYRHGSRSSVRTPATQTQVVEAPLVTGLSRETVLQMLPSKTWYWRWETKNRSRPTPITVNDDGQIFGGSAGKTWKLELRWVLNEGDHLFVPMDEYTLHGFFLGGGRQTGLFADKP